jgi:hypothetical protein
MREDLYRPVLRMWQDGLRFRVIFDFDSLL